VKQAMPLMAVGPTSPGERPWPQWRTYALIVLGLHLVHLGFESVRTDNVMVFSGAYEYLVFKGDEILRLLFTVPVFAGALHLTEGLPPTAPRRRAVAVALMLGAALIGAALMAFVPPYEPLAVRLGASGSIAVWFWYSLWVNALVGLLALVAVTRLRERRRAIAGLAHVQEQARIVRQQMAHAQLQAIQARVDPQLLFDMLAAVKRFYEQDAARAEQLLDELTAFLRAALPRLRSARSTLEVEFGLVGCYVRLLRSAHDAPIALQVTLPDMLETEEFPAGLLLPLLTPAQGALPRTSRRIGLDARIVDAALRVQVTDSTLLTVPALERLRRSLADLYGDRALLHVVPQAAGSHIVMEVPLERR
jgi:hypothetical protein